MHSVRTFARSIGVIASTLAFSTILAGGPCSEREAQQEAADQIEADALGSCMACPWQGHPSEFDKLCGHALGPGNNCHDVHNVRYQDREGVVEKGLYKCCQGTWKGDKSEREERKRAAQRVREGNYAEACALALVKNLDISRVKYSSHCLEYKVKHGNNGISCDEFCTNPAHHGWAAPCGAGWDRIKDSMIGCDSSPLTSIGRDGNGFGNVSCICGK